MRNIDFLSLWNSWSLLSYNILRCVRGRYEWFFKGYLSFLYNRGKLWESFTYIFLNNIQVFRLGRCFFLLSLFSGLWMPTIPIFGSLHPFFFYSSLKLNLYYLFITFIGLCLSLLLQNRRNPHFSTKPPKPNIPLQYQVVHRSILIVLVLHQHLMQ